MIPRESIARALFALTEPLSAQLSPPGLFITRSRQIIPAPQVPAGSMPALFQIQDVESPMEDQRTLAGEYASGFRFVWYAYTAASADPSGEPPSATAPQIATEKNAMRLTGQGLNVFMKGRMGYLRGPMKMVLTVSSRLPPE